MNNKKIRNILIIITILLIPFIAKASAEFCSIHNYSIRIDEETIKAGYTVEAFNNSFKIGIFPEILNTSTRINLKNITKLAKESGEEGLEVTSAPEGWTINSDIYEYDITQKKSYDQQNPLIIEINFGKDTDNYKKIFYFNGSTNEWKELPSKIDWIARKVRTKVYFPYVRLAIFDQKDIMGRGKTSWYNQAPHKKLFRNFNYEDGDYAAHRLYPKGTKLKVTCLPESDIRPKSEICLGDEDSVIVTINDWGPEEWTGRIIDLDVRAFKKLEWKGHGWTNVTIEPVE